MIEVKNIRREDWESLKPTVYGWGINDVNYKVSINSTVGYIDGKRKRKMIWICPYYEDWSKMIQRCYDKKYTTKYPTYECVNICEDWRYLSNFIRWVDSQPNNDWINCQLDKDLFSLDVKVYSPDTCVYLTKQINQFLTDYQNNSNEKLKGAYYHVKNNKTKPYMSVCKNPFTLKQEYLGSYVTEYEAHSAWLEKKKEFAIILSNQTEDERVAARLIEFYDTMQVMGSDLNCKLELK